MSSTSHSKCILWPGLLDKDGYGRLRLDGEIRAHRAIFKLFVGPIPPGHCVLHSCDTPACVNPAHLSVGTPSDNARDRGTKNRTARGLKNGNSKLTAEQVAAIRAGIDRHEAAQMGIKKSAYYMARKGQTYQDIGWPE